MRRSVLARLAACIALAACNGAMSPSPPAAAPLSGTFEVAGLSAPVRVVRDKWGVPHIAAETRDDLFFAQGFVQASDRLFQMDLWRRSVQGRLAEVLGANFIGRDAMTRRIQYRGNLDQEWSSYGPDTHAIASAFVRGINAWVAVARERPPELFVLAGWLPELWRPEDLLNRTDAFLASGDAAGEVFRARLVTAVGFERAAVLLGGEIAAAVPRGLDPSVVTYQVADTMRQIGTRPFFMSLASPVAVHLKADTTETVRLKADTTPADVRRVALQPDPGGSNAWAVDGERSATGSPILATDPHRLLANPSLRYLVHLTAPGWNVIGATAPWLPGVALGHNDRIAWGMTAFDADTADLFVQRLNPENHHQIEINGQWRNTTVVTDLVWVKGSAKPVPFNREYTPDGVVVGVDGERHLAFTLRWSGLEPGGASELAALALDRAGSGAEVQAALARWKMPAVEVVYAERSGPVATQVAGGVPLRSGWDGRLPAPAWTGGARWSGWRTLDDLPYVAGSAAGYVVSANGNRARTERLRERLSTEAERRASSVDGSAQLQRDTVAWNAERLVPLFASLRSERPDVEQARLALLEWNREIAADSIEARTYLAWERIARRKMVEPHVPRELVDELVARVANNFVAALSAPTGVWFAGDRLTARARLMLDALAAAVDEVTAGNDPAPLNQVLFSHPLGVDDASRRRFNIGPFQRPGYADTVMAVSGRPPDAALTASFSAVFDLADWDRSIVQQAPGQSESPDSAHFADLAKLWGEGRYFPLAFSAAAIAANAESTLTLVPRQ